MTTVDEEYEKNYQNIWANSLHMLNWVEEESMGIKDFCDQYELPQIVKLDGSNYGNFGGGTQVDVGCPILLYATRRCSKVLAANLYWDDSQQAYNEVGQRVIIPVNYPGWFHFLQDFGKVGDHWTKISHLATSHDRPSVFMTRRPVTCYHYIKASQNCDRLYGKQVLPAGECFQTGEVYKDIVESKAKSCCIQWVFGGKHVKEEISYLQCKDSIGKDLLLNFNQEGQFLPVGPKGSNDLNSVYRLVDVVRDLELPLIMKLAQGNPPGTPCAFTGMLKLEDVYIEDSIIACTLDGENPVMMEFPIDSDIKLIRADDTEELFQTPLLEHVIGFCSEKYFSYVNRMKVVQHFYPPHERVEDITESHESINVQDRTLPPVPDETEPMLVATPAVLQESVGDISMDSTFVDSDYSDHEEIPDNDSTYEVIPADSNSSLNEEPGNFRTDEEGYLVPLSLASAVFSPTRSLRDSCCQTNDSLNIIFNATSLDTIVLANVDRNCDSPSTCTLTPGSSRRMYSSSSGHGSRETTPDLSELGEVELSPGPLSGFDELKHFWGASDSLDFLPPAPIPPELHSDPEYSFHDREEFYYDGDTPKPIRKTLPCYDDSPVDNFLSLQHKTSFPEYAVPHKKTQGKAFHLDDRLNAFLTDSVQELHRLRAASNIETANNVSKMSLSSIRSSEFGFETTQNMEDYLDKIFDLKGITDDYPLSPMCLKKLSSVPDVRRRSVEGLAMAGLETQSMRIKPRQRKPLPLYSLCDPNATLRRHNLNVLRPVLNPFDYPDDQSERIYDTPPSVSERDLSPSESSIYQMRHSNPNLLLLDDQESSANADSGIYVNRNDCESIYKAPSDDLWCPPDDIETLSVRDVASSLRYIGMKEHVIRHFLEEQIDGKQLADMDGALLKEGFPDLNALERKKVCDFIHGWRPKK